MKYNNLTILNNNLPECLLNFLNYLKIIKGKSSNTIKAYKTDLTLFFRFMKLYKGLLHDKNLEFEEIPICDIDDNFLRKIKLTDFYAFLSFVEKYRGNSSYARARKVATLKSFFKFLTCKAKTMNENPTADLESPKISKRNPIYLTLNESKKLLNCIDGPNKERDYCIITLFLNCGMRLSELCSINVSMIKDDIMSIIGKGNKERTIYLNNACLKAISSYLPIRNKQLSKANNISKEDQDALFLSNRIKRINKRTVELIVKKYIKKAGMDVNKYTPHKLRHTAATLMYKYGNVDIRSLQQILGHENVSTTQIYTHVDNENLRQAVKSNPLSEE